MAPETTSPLNVRLASGRITLAYIVVSAAWITLSDRFLEGIEAGHLMAGVPYQTSKGLFFVFITGGLLYWLVSRNMTALAHATRHDAVTALPSMAVLRDRLDQAMIHARRSNRLVVVLSLNIDRFQNLVNKYGYESGDEILHAVARRLEQLVRPGDTVSRIGGDEFAVMLADIRLRSEVDHVVARLHESIQQPFRYKGHDVRFSVSGGVSVHPGDGDDSESLLQTSTTALRRARRGERGTVAFYTAQLGREAERWARIESALNGALERGEFSLHYQPQVDSRRQRYIGVEALLRWTSPTLGSVPPDEFVRVAEASPLISRIGEWVVEQASRQAALWRAQGFSLVVSINVSARQLNDRAFPRFVQRALASNKLPPGSLEIEITESLLMQDAEEMAARLCALKQVGVRLAIDDFGTGYSNLGYLRRFRADRLKIDQSFVRGLPDDPDARAIAATVVALGRTLGLKTIAEGVETAEQAHALRQLGCDEFQGYLFGRPVPAEELSLQLASVAERAVRVIRSAGSVG